MSYNEAIISSYFLFITTIFFTLSLSKKIIISINEQDINILSNKIDEDKKCNSNKSPITKENINEFKFSKKNMNEIKYEEKNEFIIHNMDLFFSELYIAFFIFDSFSDENKRLFDNIKPIIYYNNYLDIYDLKHCFILDNYENNKFGWIIISNECEILKNEIYINFSYENIDDFIIWKKNFEVSKKYYSNIIKINFYKEIYSMNLQDNHNLKSFYIIYKNNMIEYNI